PPNGVRSPCTSSPSPLRAPPIVGCQANQDVRQSPVFGFVFAAPVRILRPLALVALLLLSLGGVAGAAERPLRVVGSASLQAQVARSAEGKLRLEGKLLDDAGAGVPQAAVRMTLPGVRSFQARACGSDEFLPARGGPTLETNDSGEFCVELDPEFFGARVTLAYDDESGLL